MERPRPKCGELTPRYYLCNVCIREMKYTLEKFMPREVVLDLIYKRELDAWYAASGY